MPPPPHRQSNPIQGAVRDWLASLEAPDPGQAHSWREDLLNSAPKRFTIYEPLALLPAGSFASQRWAAEMDRRDADTLAALWSLILRELSKKAKSTLTNLAVNEGIPLHNEVDEAENVRRSPSGLRMLFGDFGPARTDAEPPLEEDFAGALWVSTKQNGILQTWAPRWTMFSRGNVKEKARLLSFPSARKRPPPAGSAGGDVWAVDLYAGIGYFVFCYASLGMRVLCWEINPWSIEGLRRGARANGWTIKIVVFLQGNEEAPRRIKEAQTLGLVEHVEHVNCGFLPTSTPTWKPAWETTRLSSECWLHLHENVGVNDIESRRGTIQRLVQDWSASEGGDRTPAVNHVEQVKTFAPGVWHCVFDVHITRHSEGT
ncbi:tRNA wybutosine-synthesizing protein 2 [Hirsutella rhossiliensis]|uniref:tRNA wybutosine-synthesizing protein 2 n=1 Tax=Hirsutella rhossiliensis TaxID=111463 RepID=A0A9P8SKX9_9HYPO|nr:tRNA wybutosine-synthesizing protein 2 [Hirsutella rhossiliensis]KAH0966888.1 tRNA wybutosine-synthesizing protein 2 [Hirsutella rhossiliensis]